jgi:phosphoribosylaminoimidazolecarboxamide formyltransferase / IMP cyclohydrolase
MAARRRWLPQADGGQGLARTAAYDAMIASWFAFRPTSSSAVPRHAGLLAFKRADAALRREPAPAAALYVPRAGTRGIAQAEQVQGKELSYNNLNDADAALELAPNLPGRRRRW